MGSCTSVHAELKAVLRSLKLARDQGFTKIWVHSDSMVTNAEYKILATQCKQLLDNPGWEVKITHCFRESNKAADALANLGVNLIPSFCFYNDPPSEIFDILYADNVGASCPGLVAT